ncbi:MAG: tetratricopeptide repeat protein [Acidobacteria bacterium]|nr:tetratricopeptide repeat protein [Acidobacteriota bacterium]
MKKIEPATGDELRPEYDLRALRVRRLGPGRKSFGGVISSGSIHEQRRPRLRWIIPAAVAALSATVLFVGGVAANLIATDLDAALKPYRIWVWVIFIIALVITVVIAVRQIHRQDELHASQDEPASKSESPPASRPPIVAGEVDGETLIVRIPTAANALHQLPPPPRDFTGRVRELDELMSRIERGGVTISGLQGLGGIGKTALALKLAQRLAPRYPDAQFYLDLKGADRQPLLVADALAHVVRAYHPTAKLPEGEAELRALYLSVLHGRRALLLMDNASGREQVEPLIPPDGCVLLVTSRQHFTLPGLSVLDLETLPPEDARQLLLKIAPRIGDRADAIASLCGYLPLALRLAASALAERANLSPADYVRRFSDAKKRLELVEASLTLSYELLSSELQRLWRSLAVFPDTFNAAAASAVWESDADATQDALGDLLRYSLLDWDADTQRYRLHDLARLFADSRMSDDEGRATRLRHATHYLTVLGECNALYLKGGDAIKSAIALFDVERRNIEAGQEWACQHASGDEMTAQLCNQYFAAGAHVLNLRQHPRESISWLEAALAAARQLKDRASEGRHSGNLGIVYKNLGEMRRAIEFHEQALVVFREIGDRHGEGYVLGNLGNAYQDLGESQRAVEFHEQALAVSRETGDRRSEGHDLGSLGIAYKNLGETRRAIEFYEQALAVSRETGDRRSEGATLGNLGVAHKELGELQRAVNFYEQQLTIVREIGDRHGEGKAMFNTGLALDELGERVKAIAHVETALDIFEQIESPGAERARALLARWRGEA